MKQKLLFLSCLFFFTVNLMAQMGIGTTTPAQMLHIYKPAGTSAIYLEQTITLPGTQNVTKSAGTGVSVGGPTEDWFNPQYITADDGFESMVDLTGEARTESDPLRATNFGFAIPAGATITGIVVEIKKDGNVYFTANKGEFTDLSVQLVTGGAATGTDHATTDIWPHPAAYVSHGASNDNWGVSLTPSMVNDPDFGVQIRVQLPNEGIIGEGDAPSVGDYAHVDHIRMTVYYTSGPTSNGWTLGSDYNDGGKFKIANGSSFSSNNYLTLTGNGNLGIGTTSPEEKLTVSGNVKATTFVATYGLAGAYKYNTTSNMTVPDYVFDQYFRNDFSTNPEYRMLGLDELGAFIRDKGHLPGVPSRDQIIRDGKINLQGMSMINLEKTEENTLYILELKKEIEILKAEIDKLKQQKQSR